MVDLCPNRPVVYAVAPEHTLGARLLVRETGPAEAPKPRLLDRVRLSALLFLYREVLGVDLPWLDDVVRAKRPLQHSHGPRASEVAQEKHPAASPSFAIRRGRGRTSR